MWFVEVTVVEVKVGDNQLVVKVLREKPLPTQEKYKRILKLVKWLERFLHIPVDINYPLLKHMRM